MSSVVGLLRLGDFGELFPPFKSVLFLLLGCSLLFGVLVRAVVEELGVDFHEEFHGVIYHTVDGSAESEPGISFTRGFE